jgi:cerevisin
MASPHAAGVLAYLLSLYPSETFNPDLFPVSVPDLRDTFTASPLSSLSSIVQTILPGWVPVPKFFQAVAPTPPKRPATLSPAQLKSAVLKLASRGVLQELPVNTSNLLIFNNATGPE